MYFGELSLRLLSLELSHRLLQNEVICFRISTNHSIGMNDDNIVMADFIDLIQTTHPWKIGVIVLIAMAILHGFICETELLRFMFKTDEALWEFQSRLEGKLLPIIFIVLIVTGFIEFLFIPSVEAPIQN